MDEIVEGRNYFKRAAVRAKTLVKGDPIVGSGLIVLGVYSGNAEVSEIMRGSAKTVSFLRSDPLGRSRHGSRQDRFEARQWIRLGQSQLHR